VNDVDGSHVDSIGLLQKQNCEGEGHIEGLVDDIGAQLCQTRDTKNFGGGDVNHVKKG
jgi:hypothetical protein